VQQQKVRRLQDDLPVARVRPAVAGLQQKGEGRQCTNRRGAGGADVMLTIFSYNFGQFSAKKLAFFLETNVMINFFHNLALL
jgi:hypothetical protein